MTKKVEWKFCSYLSFKTLMCLFKIIINHMRDQVQKLTKEISDLKNSLQEKEKAEKDLNKTIVSKHKVWKIEV